MVRIGYQATIHHLALMAAAEKGLLPTGYNMSVFPSGVPEIQAMKDGKLDAIYVCTSPLIAPIKKGLDAKIVAGVNVNGSAFVSKQLYVGPNSLNGLKVGVAPGSLQELILKKIIKDYNLTTTITDASNYPAAADAAFLPEPLPSKHEGMGHGKVVVTSEDLMGTHACCGMAVSGKLIREQPALVRQMVKAQKDATTYIQNNIHDDAKIFSKYANEPIGTVQVALKKWNKNWWISDPNLLIKDTMDYAKLMGITINQEDLFDTSFY
jgi:NitT/TauT family transport system substrate-binding protein